jgi:hypothetical protein
MAKQVLYLFGYLNADGSPCLYDTEYDNSKFFICDTAADLPSSGIGNMDLAVMKDTGTLLVGSNGSWAGQNPVHSVYFTDSEDINPGDLLGYGTWAMIYRSEFYWGWKRTA